MSETADTEITIAHPNRKLKNLPASTQVINVTSRGEFPWKLFSPFFPHAGIPVPLWPGRTGESVEGIWQGLKRFENEDEVDTSFFDNRTMRRLKRTSSGRGKSGLPRGRVLGHQRGADEAVLLNYLEARALIYLPCYLWVIENRLQDQIAALKEAAAKGPVVLLDYETNSDVLNLAKPLSHASLIRAYLANDWPLIDLKEEGTESISTP